MNSPPTARIERRIVHIAMLALCLAGFGASVSSSGAVAVGIALAAGAAGAVLARVVRTGARRAWTRLLPPLTMQASASSSGRTPRSRAVLLETGAASNRDAA